MNRGQIDYREGRTTLLTAKRKRRGAAARSVGGGPPECVIVDWELPERAALEDVRRSAPGVYIVVTSARPEAAVEALAAQADVFVAQTDSPDVLLDALQRLGA